MKWLCFYLMLHRSSFLERSTDSYKYLVQANIWWELVRNIFSEINFPLQGRKERSVIFVGNSWNMRQKCFVKVSEVWCFPAFGGVFQLHRSCFSTRSLTQHDMCASSACYTMWNSQEEGWDDSGSWDAAAWMARRREALLFQGTVTLLVSTEGQSPGDAQWLLLSISSSLLLEFLRRMAQLLELSMPAAELSHQPWLILCSSQDSNENSHIPLIYGSAITFPSLSQCWLLHGYLQLERTYLYFATACCCRSRKCKLQLQSNVVEMSFSLLLALQFQHRIWLVKVDSPKTFVNDLCSFFSINFKGLREIWAITLKILICSFESIPGHAC